MKDKQTDIGDNSDKRGRSQIANDCPFVAPTSELLSSPEGPAEIIFSARNRALSADARRNDSLYVELATCFHVACYIRSNPTRWDDFRDYTELDKVDYVGDAKILYEVIKFYTGENTDGLKKASRYNRALIATFITGRSGHDAYRELKTNGVDGLLKSRESNPTIANRRPRAAAIRIKTAITTSGIVHANAPQTILIKLTQDMSFRLMFFKATSRGGAMKKRP